LSENGRKKVEALRGEADEAEQKLVSRSQAFAEDQKRQNADWKSVRDSLHSRGADAAVEFVRYPSFDGKKWTDTSHYAAIVITPNSETPQFVFLGDAANLEGEPLREYRSWVARPAEPTSATPNAQIGHVFYDAFWKPLEPVLGSAKRVYVAPDGVLNQVSLAVVPLGDGRLLSDRLDLRILNGTADLLRSSTIAQSNTAVLIGNPKFSLSAHEQQQEVASLNRPQQGAGAQVLAVQSSEFIGPSTKPLSRGLLRGNSDGACEGDMNVVPTLPGTENEVRDVFSRLQQQGWALPPPLTGSNALEEAVKRVHHPRVLHIATHGFFLPDPPSRGQQNSLGGDDPMLRSGLLLAGAARSICGASPAEGLDDGVLTAYEASLLDLQGTELVVLSACETGLGATRAGEGVFGLRRAFAEAGADSLLISMWQVPDEETTRLMSLFYQNWLAGNDKQSALQMAQHQLRAELKARNEDHPFYWGAFVLIGQ
jgi:CHAT domain-containing protein